MTHLTERDRERGTREQRGYGPEFARQRRRYAARIAAGEVIPCWRCGQPVTTDYWPARRALPGVRLELRATEKRITQLNQLPKVRARALPSLWITR